MADGQGANLPSRMMGRWYCEATAVGFAPRRAGGLGNVTELLPRPPDGPRRGRQASSANVPRRPPAAAASSFISLRKPAAHGEARLRMLCRAPVGGVSPIELAGSQGLVSAPTLPHRAAADLRRRDATPESGRPRHRGRSRAPPRVVGLRSKIKEEESAAGGFRGTFAEKARRPQRGPSDHAATRNATRNADRNASLNGASPATRQPGPSAVNSSSAPHCTSNSNPEISAPARRIRSRAPPRVVGLRSKIKEEESAFRRIPGDICGEGPPPAAGPSDSAATRNADRNASLE